jgi:hypothetical protein
MMRKHLRPRKRGAPPTSGGRVRLRMIKETPRQRRDAPIDARAQSLGTAMKSYYAYLAVLTTTSCCRPCAMTSASRGCAEGQHHAATDAACSARFSGHFLAARAAGSRRWSQRQITERPVTSRFAVAGGLDADPSGSTRCLFRIVAAPTGRACRAPHTRRRPRGALGKRL